MNIAADAAPKTKPICYSLPVRPDSRPGHRGRDGRAVLWGSGLSDCAAQLGQYGADRVYLADFERLAAYTADLLKKPGS